MLAKKTTERILQAIAQAPNGIMGLDVLESLKLCNSFTLKTTLSRLGKSERILRLKRGVYSVNPMKDAFICAQNVFNGYLGFTSALYLHGLIAEMPFTATVVTPNVSKTKLFSQYEFKAVALHEKAVGFERKQNYIISTRAKTLFDCRYLPRHSIEYSKLVKTFHESKLTAKEWNEFDGYVKKFANEKQAKKMNKIKQVIQGKKIQEGTV